MTRTQPPCFILPPHVLVQLAERGDTDLRRTATRALAASASIRSRRQTLGELAGALNLTGAQLRRLAPAAAENKTVYDVQHGGFGDLPGEKRRGEGDAPVADDAVNEAFDGADRTHDFYRDVFHRDSVDGQGMELISSVHFGTNFDNAFWDGTQMVYGDGSGRIFVRGGLTKDTAVIAHEITHGVVQFTANLPYSKQSGALNESMADCFGSMVKQHTLGQTVEEADWLIGADILGSALDGVALRSMKAPGTAFDGDNQPDTMDNFVDLPDDGDPRNDNGGVHINSGIPNRAFYLTAIELGGHSWEKAGTIWYRALTEFLPSDADFAAAAEATAQAAAAEFGSAEKKIVKAAWAKVGVR